MRPASRHPSDLTLTRPRYLPNLDWALIAAAVAMTLFGVITIWGGSAVDGTAPAFGGSARAQARWLVISLAAVSVILVIDYRWSHALAWPCYLLLIAVLVGLLLFGRPINNAKSWLVIRPLGFSIQPSEPGKIIVIIALARYLSERMLTFKKFSDTLAPLAIVGLPAVLIGLQPDFGTAAIYVPVTAAMFFVAGLRKRVFVLFALLAVAAGAMTYPLLKDYQQQRIQTFLNPGSDILGAGYHVHQAQTALGSGRLTGKGWGYGTQTGFRFLPEYQTDFIFSSLGEQFGLAGCLVALGLYGFLILRMVLLAGASRDLYGVLLITGMTALLASQIALNIGVATALLPVTGVPLPFLSRGGSFLLTCFTCIGLTMNVGARSRA